MAEQISDFTALGGAPATGDLIPVVDISDTTDAPSGTTKKMTVANLLSSSSGYATVQDEGSGLTQRSTINFTGAGVTASDDGSKTNVNIPGGGGGTTSDPLGMIMQHQVSNVSALRVDIGTNGTSGETGSSSADNDSDGLFCKWTSATTLNAEAGVSTPGGGAMTQTRCRPIFYAKVKPTGTITELRTFVGLTSGTTQLGLDAPLLHYAGFRFSTVAGDTNWQCVTDNGSGSPTVTNSGVAYTVDALYTLRIDVSDPASIKFYINGSLVATHTTTLPTTTQDISWFARVRNTGSTNAKAIKINRLVISMP